MSVFDHSKDTVYIPSGGDVRHLSRAEKLALIDKAGLELQKDKVVEDQALEAVMRLLSVSEIKAIITRAGLSSRDAVDRDDLSKRGLQALSRLRKEGVNPTRRRSTVHMTDAHVPVTWKRFEVTFDGPTMGFTTSLDKGGNLSVTKVTGAAALASGLRPKDYLVSLNDAGFGKVPNEAHFMRDVIQRLKLAPRPLRLGFVVGDGRWPPTLAQTAPEETPEDDLVHVDFTKTGSLGFAVALRNSVLEVTNVRENHESPCYLQKVKAGDHLVSIAGRSFGKIHDDSTFHILVAQLKHAERPMRLTFKRQRKQPAVAFAEDDTKKKMPAPLSRSESVMRRSRGMSMADSIYRYEATFPKNLMGVAFALARSVELGTLHVQVTELRPACSVEEVEVGDQLVKIEDEDLEEVTSSVDFKSKVLEKLRRAPRPLKLTFSSGVRTVVTSASYATEIFEEIDVGDDGFISQIKLIKALKKNVELAGCLQLPQVIRQEDGSRDKFAALFQSLAIRDDKLISKREWASGLALLASETIL